MDMIWTTAAGRSAGHVRLMTCAALLGLGLLAWCSGALTPAAHPVHPTLPSAATSPVALDAPPSLQPPPRTPVRRLCVVHKSHTVTPRLLSDAVRARDALLAVGGLYTFLYWSDNDPALAARHAADLALLRAALGPAHVTAVDDGSLWPAMRRRLFRPPSALQRAALQLGVRLERLWVWLGLRKKRAKQRWQWRACDTPDLLWYRLVRGTLPRWVTHVWVMEYDIGWTGDLPTLLASISDEASDWVAYDPGHPGKGWHGFAGRNWLRDADVWSNLVQLVRYSPRLLDAITANVERGLYQYCEVTGISTCRVNLTDCRVSGFKESPALGREVVGDRTLFSYNTHLDAAAWRAVVERDRAENASRLYHAVKC